MWLTKNEKKVLRLLLFNSRVSDTTIGKELNVTSQAVGRIRQHLEKEIIVDYKLNLDASKLGIGVCALIKVYLLDVSKKEYVEKNIVGCKNVSLFVKSINEENMYFLMVSFSDIDHLEDFLNKDRLDEKMKQAVLFKEVFPFSQKNVLKNSCRDLYEMMIDHCVTKRKNIKALD